MAVINRKPHKLQYHVRTTPEINEDGDLMTKGRGYAKEAIDCYAESSGASKEMVCEDGVVRTYSYTIYLDKDCRTFVIGDKVALEVYTNVIREFIVKGFQRYQTCAKLWV